MQQTNQEFARLVLQIESIAINRCTLVLCALAGSNYVVKTKDCITLHGSDVKMGHFFRSRWHQRFHSIAAKCVWHDNDLSDRSHCSRLLLFNCVNEMSLWHSDETTHQTKHRNPCIQGDRSCCRLQMAHVDHDFVLWNDFYLLLITFSILWMIFEHDLTFHRNVTFRFNFSIFW